MTISFLTAFLSASVRMAIPLLYAGLGETISQKAGTLNIGLEANMLGGAFFGFMFAYLTNNIFIGFIGSILGGVIFSMIHAFISVSLYQNQSVTGTALNIFALGVTGFLFQIICNHSASYPQIATLPNIRIPYLCDIPIIGESFFKVDCIMKLDT